jgi:hypothetical protein
VIGDESGFGEGAPMERAQPGRKHQTRERLGGRHEPAVRDLELRFPGLDRHLGPPQ